MTHQTIIGITGGSGCGKTTALHALEELGVKIIDCDAKTIVIPAYHRADERKCADLPLGAASHKLRVEISDAKDFEEFYFYTVSPDFYFAYRLDSMYSAE